MKCEECGEECINQCGCWLCVHCGWSVCLRMPMLLATTTIK